MNKRLVLIVLWKSVSYYAKEAENEGKLH